MAATFDTPLYSSDQSIDRVLKAGLPVLLVFTQGAALPALDQALKTTAKQQAGKLLVVQLDLKDSAQTAGRFQIHSAPAVVAIKDGQPASQAEGISAPQLEQHVRYLLGTGPRPQLEDKTQAGPAPTPAANQTPYRQPPQRPAPAGAPAQPVTVTDASFDQEVMRSSLPVVVDFWAPWCGPCRMVAPVLDKLAREWNGKVKIAKVNVDENPSSGGRYGVQAIPTMMVVKNGKVLDRWAGALPEAMLRSRLTGLLKDVV